METFIRMKRFRCVQIPLRLHPHPEKIAPRTTMEPKKKDILEQALKLFM